MSPTSKLLQTPQILSITGSTIRIAHPDISKYTRTRVASPIASAGTTLSVTDNNGFADNDWFLIGEIGDSKTETNDVNGAVTRGTSITVTNALSFGHEIDAPVTKIFERGIKIYGAETDGGSGTLIASIDAETASGRQLADATMIEWNKPWTEYTLISTDTTYAYYYATFTDGTTDSPVSDYVLAGGTAYNSGYEMVNSALREVNAEVDEYNITWDWLLDVLNDWQDEVTHFVTADGTSKDWSFELAEDSSSLTSVQNTEKYDLSNLTNNLKYPDSQQGILEVKLGKNKLKYADFDEIMEKYDGIPRTEVEIAASAGDTSVTLDDTYEFAESGTVYLGTDTVTYTTNTEATGVLSGIPASGTGSITATQAVDSVVWQGVSPGEPEKYTIFNGYIWFDKPVNSANTNLKLKFKYIKVLNRLTSLSETTSITIPHTAKFYIGAKIEERKNNIDNSERLLTRFQQSLEKEARKDRVQLAEQFDYYTFSTHKV